MSVKRTDLYKRCLFVLSGVSNALGRVLAIEMCSRFKPGSVAVLVGAVEEELQTVKKEIQFLESGVEAVCCVLNEKQSYEVEDFRKVLEQTLAPFGIGKCAFELAFILHNEGLAATRKLIEPQDSKAWQAYVKEHFLAPVALNQAFLQAEQCVGLEKLIVNLTSSIWVKPLVYNSVTCSCKQARDMYFRALASEENDKSLAVLTYGPGILKAHAPEYDLNNNMVDLFDLNMNDELLQLPRVEPRQASLKLINILEEMSFISGHDVDYYDTFNL